jgi:haloalkane dehalogenase
MPALILWGMKDFAFREQELRRLETVFANATTVRFEEAGHFVQEECPDRVSAHIRDFLGGPAAPELQG